MLDFKSYSSTFFSIVLFFTSFITNLQALEFNTDLKRAEELLEATLFDEAISIYQLILQERIDNPSKLVDEYVKVRLAQAFIAEKKYSEAILCLEPHLKESPVALDLMRLYLLAISYRNLGKYEKAIISLEQYLQSAEAKYTPYELQVKLEMGLSLFLLNKPLASKKYFESITKEIDFTDNYFLAQIYLARVALYEKKWKESEQILESLESFLPKDNVLNYQAAYWHGKVLYEQGRYSKAVEYFEKSLPKQHIDKAEWYFDALFQLGMAYLSLGNTVLIKEEQNTYYTKAQSIFTQLTTTPLSENAYLGLAKVYLAFYTNYQEEAACAKAHEILSQQDIFISLEAKAQVLLLKTNLEKEYEKKLFYLKLLTDESYRETTYFPQGWFLRGLNDYQEGSRLIQGGSLSEGIKLLDKASYSFEKAFTLLKEIDPSTSALAAKLLIETYLNQHTVEANLKAYHFLEKLFLNHINLINTLKDPGEIYYLHGLVASLLAAKGDTFKETAKNNLCLCLREYPESVYAHEALYLLGCLRYSNKEYFQAEEAFLRIITEFPSSKFRGNAYFWLAKSLSKQQKEASTVAAYKRKVYEEFPTSPYAAEAYFTTYTYRSYLQGERQAIKHLMAFNEKFPNSYLLINAYYLIGMDARRDRKTIEGKWIKKKNLKEAIEAFSLAEAAFDQFFEAGQLPEEDVNYYISLRYNCTLERALANLCIADDSLGAKKRIFLEYAEEVLQQLCDDFKNSEHSLTKKLILKEPYPRLLEESTYWLSQALTKNQNEEEAEKKLNEMLEHYKIAKVTRSYFLSRAYYDLGMIALRKESHSQALKFFLLSEDAAKGKFISSDQKIDLWIQQSLCYRKLEDIDKSMLILSKAINDEAISSLRVKAMYLRAELYILQGRPELAKKQLESTSKNSGEWAKKAKQKLNEDYGYQ